MMTLHEVYVLVRIYRFNLRTPCDADMAEEESQVEGLKSKVVRTDDRRQTTEDRRPYLAPGSFSTAKSNASSERKEAHDV